MNPQTKSQLIQYNCDQILTELLHSFSPMKATDFLARMTKASPLSTACKYLKVKTSQILIIIGKEAFIT